MYVKMISCLAERAPMPIEWPREAFLPQNQRIDSFFSLPVNDLQTHLNVF